MSSGQNLLVQNFCLFVFSLKIERIIFQLKTNATASTQYLFKICRGQIVLSFSNIWVILAQFRLVNLESSLVISAGTVIIVREKYIIKLNFHCLIVAIGNNSVYGFTFMPTIPSGFLVLVNQYL